MKIIASRSLYAFMVLIALIFAASYFLPAARALGIICDALILVVLVVDYQITPRPWLLTARRDTSDRLSIGRANPVTIDIFSQAPNPLFVRVRDNHPETITSDVEEFEFELPAKGHSLIKYELTPRKRGLYQFGDIHIRYRSMLGLFWRQAEVKASRQVKVYSDLRALYDLSIRLSQSSELGELHQRKRGQGTDFASLREYTVGDDSKAIDWKATARRERPVVRTYEAEQEQRLLILIDAGRMMVSDLEGLTRFDHALNSALCLALTGLSHNDQVGVGVFADRPLTYLPPRRGKVYMKKILEGLFDIEPRMVEPDYVGVLSYFASQQKGRSLIVVLTDLTDAVGSHALLAGLASLSGRHLPFCVTLKDRQIISMSQKGVLKGPNDRSVSTDEIYQRAVATDLLVQRELALSVLQRRGCLVLDCPPQELSDRLVDSYLDIKIRGRL
ncbi:MAG TPA: DUF58 domain-containing protein [Candidatus Obscuribacterales bacterium]